MNAGVGVSGGLFVSVSMSVDMSVSMYGCGGIGVSLGVSVGLPTRGHTFKEN